jgi:hypothetical protein
MAQAHGLSSQLAAMCAVTKVGTYAQATLMPNWPPGSSLLIISIQRREVLPKRVLGVIQLQEG